MEVMDNPQYNPYYTDASNFLDWLFWEFRYYGMYQDTSKVCSDKYLFFWQVLQRYLPDDKYERVMHELDLWEQDNGYESTIDPETKRLLRADKPT